MDVIMPKMGESVNEGTIIKWHKKEGENVKRDEVIFEISTDKVDTEIPSPVDGVLSQINTKEGDTVEVGTVVATIETNGNAPTAKKDAQPEQKAEQKVEEKKQESPKPVESVAEQVHEKPAETSAQGNLMEVKMPKMGESVMEGTIIKWLKKTGEKIKKDETLFEISTDKVDTEVPSPYEGSLAEILVGEQETVEVGTVVAKISTGETIKKVESEEKKQSASAKEPEKLTSEPTEMHENFSGAVASNLPAGQASLQEENKEKSTLPSGRQASSRFYSPLVMNIAQKENVSFSELEKIEGSGLNGRVTKNDILAYIKNRGEAVKQKVEVKQEPAKEKPAQGIKGAPAPSFAPSVLQPSYSSTDVERIPMDNIRQKIMEHMILSRDTSVHVTALIEVDMTKIHNFIQRKRSEILQKENIKLTYMPFIANAVVRGLKELPLINSSIEQNTIIRKKFINLGIAVAIEPTGLIVPNIKSADEKNIIGLAKSITDLAERARTKKLTPDDISDGTFTITNYGVFGTIFGTPIINQPEVAILGVGAVIKRPVVMNIEGTDTIAIKPMMYLTLSHDHRLVDGMLGGKFLKYMKDTLENFDENIL